MPDLTRQGVRNLDSLPGRRFVARRSRDAYFCSHSGRETHIDEDYEKREHCTLCGKVFR